MKDILAMAIGNTRTLAARIEQGRVGPVTAVPTADTTPALCDRILAEALAQGAVNGAVIGSTVPRQTPAWRQAWRRCGGQRSDLLVVTPDLDPGFPVRYPGRATLGADRLAALCRASARYGRPLVVVDLGTAITVNLLKDRAGFVGGFILPGPALQFRALPDGTAALPDLSGRAAGPVGSTQAVGRDTESSMRLGVVEGCAAALEHLVRRARKALRAPRAPVVLTGGGLRIVRPRIEPPVLHDPDLLLFGLARLFEIRRGQGTERQGCPGTTNRRRRRAQDPA